MRNSAVVQFFTFFIIWKYDRDRVNFKVLNQTLSK